LKISNETSQNILFSPGFPSGNDFKNFEDRGIFFNESVKKTLSNDI
jgi:UDP-N-acetylmuramoylalanine-D-glutamate ligase